MGDYTWEYLKKFWMNAEQWLESEESHWAVLVARALHADRVIANENAESVDPVPVVESDAAAPAVTTTPASTSTRKSK